MPSRYSVLPSLAFIFFILIFLYALTAPIYSGDVGWQIRAGQALLTTGDVPRTAFLTHTAPDHIWVAQEWLSGLIFAQIDASFGWTGLLVLRALLFSGLFWAAFALGRSLGAEPISWSLLLVPITAILALNTAIRPWLFSNLLLVLTLWILFKSRENRRFFWGLIPLFGLWAPLHGAWVMGGAIVGAFALEWLIWPLRRGPSRGQILGVGLASLLVIAMGPYGLETLFFPLKYLLRDELSGVAIMYREIKEWAPPELSSFFGRLLLGLGVLTLIALFRLPHSRVALGLLAVVFFWLSLRVQRHMPIFALISLPILAMGLSRPFVKLGGRFRLFSALERSSRLPLFLVSLPLLAISGWIIASPPLFASERLAVRGYPEAAAACLAQNEGGRLLNHYDWGGYIPWKAPQWTVFITPIPDSYPAAIFEDWLALVNLEAHYPALLEKYPLDGAIFPHGTAIVRALEVLPGWRRVYADEHAVILLNGEQRAWSCDVKGEVD